MAHLLCINALEEIDCYDKVCEYTPPRRYPRPAADVIAQCYPSVGSVSARKVGEDTSAAIVLTVEASSARSTQTVALADVQCTSPLVRDDGDIALRIYFAQAGEDMFDIAKRYGGFAGGYCGRERYRLGHPGSAAAPADTVGYLRRGEKTGWIIAIFIQTSPPRTGGDIYIGVVGPVRTGKSTFIKRFMELMVLPGDPERGVQPAGRDELPQSAAGRTIMTTEPKFVLEQAVSIDLEDGASFRIVSSTA